MSLNFANEAFYSKVSCSCVCADGFEVTNLNSKDQAKKTNGFQGERFVRTPATIQFQFYIPISIHKIEFTPYIGRQCCKIIQLWVSDTYSLARKNKSSQDEESVPNNAEDKRYRKASTVALSEPSKAVFVNRGYRQHPQLSISPIDGGHKVEYTHGNLNSITALRICIRQMLQGSIPSLSSLRIWGRPARSCHSALCKEIFFVNQNLTENMKASASIKLYDSSTGTCNVSPSQPNSTNQNEIQSQSSDSQLDPYQPQLHNQCPPEFLDPLTCEPMRVPVLLPSGHTVDRTTLDKHIKSQSEMGNIPSDPFTGIPFTHCSKPQPNVELKIRMDNYSFQQSKLADCNQNVYQNLRKRLFSTLSEIQDEDVSPTIAESQDSHKKLKMNKSANRTSNHSTDLTASLNEALANLNQGKGSCERKLSMGAKTVYSNLYCSKCNIFLSSEVVRYRLPCTHIMCFSCLRKPGKKGVNCPICVFFYEFKSVERIHN